MQQITHSFRSFRLRSLKALGLGALLMAPSLSAQAFSFGDKEGVSGSFDTTVSYGVAWRTQNSSSGIVAKANGGATGNLNSDDGDLNYGKGDLISSAVKATHDLALNYRNFGFFGRASYFYDFENANNGLFNSELKGKVGYDFQILDFYVRGDFKPADKNLQVRVGKQVVNWGESTFIGNGINVINPVSLPKLRVPGSEIKEALLPSPMVWASQEITENVSVEAFALAQFKKTILDPRGSYFSTTDILSDGGNFLYAGSLSGRPDQHQVPAKALALGGAFGAQRSSDREASDHGEFGFSGHFLAPQWNNTEFGLFFANYHSRTPIFSVTRGGATAPGAFHPAFPNCKVFNAQALLGAAPSGCPAGITPAASYFAEYPENIQLWGASFNTPGPLGLALQGEYSYRPNMPLQLSTNDLVDAAVGLGNFITGAGNTVATRDVPMGSVIRGYDRVEMHQVQVSATKAFGPTWGAEQLTVLGEIGFTHLNLPDGRYYAAPGALAGPGACAAAVCGKQSSTGFATENSWGYRLRASLDYPNLIGAVKVSPNVAYSSDVQGYGPTFSDGFKSASAGLTFTYREQWKGDITYVNFFGNPNNSSIDRDFLSISASYSF
jgi:hypothetical protein